MFNYLFVAIPDYTICDDDFPPISLTLNQAAPVLLLSFREVSRLPQRVAGPYNNRGRDLVRNHLCERSS